MELRHTDTAWYITGDAHELMLLAHLCLSAALTDEPNDDQIVVLGENTQIVATRDV